jgi:hypothetical protein
MWPTSRSRVACPSAARIAGVFAALCLAVPGLALTEGAAVHGRAPAGACPAIARGFSCLMRWRIRAAQRYLAGKPGRIGLVLHDRLSGATWRDANAAADFPAASTMKLAMVTDVLLRARGGRLALSPTDWTLIHQALHQSSDAAADRLWFAFEDGRFLRRITRFGMTSGSFSASQPYWGYMYCSPEDLDNLMNYVLGELPGGERDYLVRQLRHVAPIQQWGVWGAGQSGRPGNKDGWEDDGGTWVTNSVGFAGPGARYTLAIMYELRAPRSGFRIGTNLLTQLSALLFQGDQVPRPMVEATP